MFNPRGFHDLVRRAQAGDPQAKEQLLGNIRPLLEELASGFTDTDQPDESGSDLVQDASLRVWQKLVQFHGAGDDQQTWAMFRAWVGQMVRNLGVSAQRHRDAQRRHPPQKILRLLAANPAQSTSMGNGIDLAASAPSPSSNARANEQAERVRAALEKISDETDRAIVRLRFFQGLSLHQIAERLGMSYDKVVERSHAGLKTVERELRGLL